VAALTVARAVNLVDGAVIDVKYWFRRGVLVLASTLLIVLLLIVALLLHERWHPSPKPAATACPSKDLTRDLPCLP
jgi:hypothetical protein